MLCARTRDKHVKGFLLPTQAECEHPARAGPSPFPLVAAVPGLLPDSSESRVPGAEWEVRPQNSSEKKAVCGTPSLGLTAPLGLRNHTP